VYFIYYTYCVHFNSDSTKKYLFFFKKLRKNYKLMRKRKKKKHLNCQCDLYYRILIWQSKKMDDNRSLMHLFALPGSNYSMRLYSIIGKRRRVFSTYLWSKLDGLTDLPLIENTLKNHTSTLPLGLSPSLIYKKLKSQLYAIGKGITYHKSIHHTHLDKGGTISTKIERQRGFRKTISKPTHPSLLSSVYIIYMLFIYIIKNNYLYIYEWWKQMEKIWDKKRWINIFS
jgi:hypothetical protein